MRFASILQYCFRMSLVPGTYVHTSILYIGIRIIIQTLISDQHIFIYIHIATVRTPRTFGFAFCIKYKRSSSFAAGLYNVRSR